jgi:hypothetical protein
VGALPHLVQLHRDLADQVACVTLNIDYTGDPDEPPESCREQALGVLTGIDATFTNVLCSDPDEQVYEMLDLAAVPAVYVYDRQGKLRKRFDNEMGEYGAEGFDYDEHVKPFVQQLLAE